MKKLLLCIFLIVPVFSTFSQERYLEPITDSVTKETHTYIIKKGRNLDLDIYMPAEDSALQRAVVVFVHGGGFQGGQRDSRQNVDFCNQLAQFGYVVASISYRLTRKGKKGGFGCQCSAKEKMNTFRAAVEDLQDATFYLIENRQELKINPKKIIIAGSSAGAETVLNAAYQPPVCFGLDSGSVDYAGVISMAGAIPDTSAIYGESAIPSLLFHGTDDNLVPYATAPHHYCTPDQPGYLVLHGSYTIAQKLAELEVPYWLHTTCGGGHEMAGKPKTTFFSEIVDFCYTYIIKNRNESRETILKTKSQKNEYQQFNFCQNETSMQNLLHKRR